MSWISVLCGQSAMLLFVVASHRGNRVFWHDCLTAQRRRVLKSCAAAVLLLSLVLQAVSDGTVILNMIEWILLAGPEIMVATLACSLRERSSRP
ncbi:hypothetical protein [Gluconobacter sp. P1C6_b]|uniref:hypothetical protein n=1 Tax=Gluconobacter sp. P1C6_b TaxID=2762619 RepID=UPI001C05507C|nr:hypothetical protein [Gluconobacter sp. P1C6_b]